MLGIIDAGREPAAARQGGATWDRALFLWQQIQPNGPNDWTLDAYRAAGPPAALGRGAHRIEHLETLGDATLARLAAEGVAASMQPLHMQWRRGDHEDSWAARLGPERAARAWRTRDILDSGALLPLGSDWPVAQYDPRIGMAWARLRRTPGRPDAPSGRPCGRRARRRR